MNAATTATVQAESLDDYARQFRIHKDLVRAHLIGKCEDDCPLLPSFFPPASFWTSSEKGLFFHGLSVFSRLRPDLIAEHIKTKSTFDVCLYLDALHTGSLKECSGTSMRDELEPAMEVSEEWIEHEEILSKALASHDSCGPDIDRSQLELPRLHSPCASQNQNDKLETSPGPQGSTDQEKRDKFLSHLDSTCLTVMERLIRESREDVDMKIPSLAADSRALDIGLEGQSPATDSNNQLLDPDLSDSTQAENAYSLELQRKIKKRLYMRRRRAQAAGKTSISEAIKLRPGRQKKLGKPPKPRPKTYNTKNKKDTISRSNSESDDESIPLEAGSPRHSVSEQMDEDVVYGRTQGGLTRPYRLRNFCLQHGLDGQTLVGMDLNFFHLSTIGRLLRLYNSLDESPRDLNAVSISADSIRILVNITTEFVSEVIHRAIITKEQEIRLKQTLKVWRYDREEINGENVTECLKSMGLGKLDKDDLFSRILGQDADGASTTGFGSPSRELQPSEETSIYNEQSHTLDGNAHPAEFVLPESMLWCSLPSYSRFFPSDDVLSPDIDEAELKRELKAEKKLDTQDRKRSAEFEALLWEGDQMKELS